jgi:lipopolysaccharide/colanic/teichoic acid biosynthesis glycosyltransferase
MAWLFVASVLTTVVASAGFRAFDRPRSSAYRRSFIAALAVMGPVWCWLYLTHAASLSGALVTLAGAFAGGVVLTASTTGLVEDNAPPSPEVREKVLAYHAFANLRYPPPPRFKRTLDVALSFVGLLVTLPLWFVIGFVIWLEEPGPIFFTKNSVGRSGVNFRQLKFRSMRFGAERLTGPVASSPHDPRTLKWGRWLRRWHVDELPELTNVLTGTMSVVGPRPLRTVMVQGYLEEVPGFAERHTVRPGIACIAQIEKCQMPAAERLRKDRVYIRRMSLGLDARLLLRAVTTTVRGTRHES